jgi:DNA repair protein RecO (recombination protein O)
MLITVNGITLKERIAGENRFIDVLTNELGLIEISAGGTKRITNSNMSATGLFVYSKLCLKSGKNIYYINSSEPINVFYGLSADIKRLAIASYFAEIVLYSGIHEQSHFILNLLLNALHFICEGSMDKNTVKSVFELRFAAYIGFLPRMEDFSPVTGNAAWCWLGDSLFLPQNSLIPDSVHKALIHILSADPRKAFSFKLGEQSNTILSGITENYLANCLEREFKTLTYYKAIKNEQSGESYL